MKKILALTLIALLILTGCQQNESKEQLIVFSFHGSDEQLTITNGVQSLMELLYYKEKTVFLVVVI